MITIDDFKKIELRTAKVLSAEPVPNSEKLLRLLVDCGDPEPRQILSGIAAYYTPESLVGRTIIIVANLEPRQMMGLESRGMVVAAGDEMPVLLTTSAELPPGSKIR